MTVRILNTTYAQSSHELDQSFIIKLSLFSHKNTKIIITITPVIKFEMNRKIKKNQLTFFDKLVINLSSKFSTICFWGKMLTAIKICIWWFTVSKWATKIRLCKIFSLVACKSRDKIMMFDNKNCRTKNESILYVWRVRVWTTVRSISCEATLGSTPDPHLSVWKNVARLMFYVTR